MLITQGTFYYGFNQLYTGYEYKWHEGSIVELEVFQEDTRYFISRSRSGRYIAVKYNAVTDEVYATKIFNSLKDAVCSDNVLFTAAEEIGGIL